MILIPIGLGRIAQPDLRSSRPFSHTWALLGFSLVGMIASATKLLREEGGRRPAARDPQPLAADLRSLAFFTLYNSIWG
jgi:hypothetical protein